ncbi:hypothetical protein D3C84_925690 [compost metagenome]
MATGLEDLERLLQHVGAEAVQHHVVVMQDTFEVLMCVVDHQIGPQRPDPFDIRGAGGCGDKRTEVFGKLNGNGADTAGTRVNQHFLAPLQSSGFNQYLPGGQCNQGQGRGLCHVGIGGFHGDRVFIHGDQLGERPDPRFGRASVDFVSRFEACHLRADIHHDARQVITQYQRK